VFFLNPDQRLIWCHAQLFGGHQLILHTSKVHLSPGNRLRLTEKGCTCRSVLRSLSLYVFLVSRGELEMAIFKLLALKIIEAFLELFLHLDHLIKLSSFIPP
jgi:hypothetical protein